VTERVRHWPCNRKIAGSIPIHSHFATPFSKEFDLTMLTKAAIASPRWPGELPGTTLANQHNEYVAKRSLLTLEKYIIIINPITLHSYGAIFQSNQEF